MSRRKNTESNVRKLTKVGPKSLSVVLPIDYLRELGWKERQKVVVKKRGQKLTIEDWKKE
jgi:antitoxin component of MazEF toxin-antitoxin module